MSGERADFGARLRAAREARGLSQKDVANATKISALVLAALERNDISRLPGGLFSRGLLRAYAKEVGLDPEQTVREFTETFSGEDTAGREEESLRIRRPATDLNGPSAASALRWLGLSVALLLVVVWVGVSHYQRGGDQPAATASAGARTPKRPSAAPVSPKPPAVSPSQPVTGGSVQGSAPGQAPAPLPGERQPEKQPEAGGAPADRTAPQAPNPPGAPGQAVPDAAAPSQDGSPVFDPGLPLQIVLSARSPCWVSASVDGNRVAGRTLQPGEKVRLSAAKAIALTAGDAAALSYTVNNAPGRPLGAQGQVVTVVITPNNYATFTIGRQ
jgi:cytoskeleton protein RodZ